MLAKLHLSRGMLVLLYLSIGGLVVDTLQVRVQHLSELWSQAARLLGLLGLSAHFLASCCFCCQPGRIVTLYPKAFGNIVDGQALFFSGQVCVDDAAFAVGAEYLARLGSLLATSFLGCT